MLGYWDDQLATHQVQCTHAAICCMTVAKLRKSGRLLCVSEEVTRMVSGAAPCVRQTGHSAHSCSLIL